MVKAVLKVRGIKILAGSGIKNNKTTAAVTEPPSRFPPENSTLVEEEK